MIKKFYLVGVLALLGLQPISAKWGHIAKKVSVVQTQASDASDVAPLYVDKDQGPSISVKPEVENLIQQVNPSSVPIESLPYSKEKIVKGYDAYYDNEKQELYNDWGLTYDDKHRLVRKDYFNTGDYDYYVYSEDSKGRTIHVDKYECKVTHMSFSKVEYQETLTSSKTYSYDHMIDGATEDKAYLVEDVVLPESVNRITRYVWFAPKQCFICISGYYNTDANKGEVGGVGIPQITVGDDSYSCVWINPKTNSKKYEYTQGYGDCDYNVFKKYDENTGELVQSQCGGTKSVVEKQNGKIATTTYTYTTSNDGSWVPSSKTVVTENYNDSWLNDGQHREREEYSYNASNGQFEIDRKRTYDWLHKNPNILLERDYTYYTDGTTEVESSTEVVDDKGTWLSYIDGYEFTPFVFKDGRCALDLDDAKQHGSSDGDTFTDIYVFYDKDGKEQARYRLNFVENTSRRVTPLEIYKDGRWQNFEIPGDSYTLQLGDMYNYGTMEFNKEGYLVKTEEYEDNALYSTLLYTYTDNSCKEEIYKYDNGKKYLDEWNEYSLSSDGTATTVSRYYLGDIDEDGEKTVVTPEGVCYHYRWDSSTKDFNSEPSYVSVSDVSSTVNGVNTTISRSWENGQIVETQKNERKQEENGDSWSVTYNKVDNEWKPETKSVEEKSVAKPKFEVVMPKSEITAMKSTSAITDVDNSYFSGGSEMQSQYTYHWDDANDDWSVMGGQAYSCSVEGNTLTYSATSYSNNGSQSKQISYTRDADNRLVEYTLETENTDNSQYVNEAKAANAVMNANVMPQSSNSESSSLTKKFEYDEKSRLAAVTIITDHEEKYVLHYADEPTGIDLVKSPVSVQHVSINGKNIRVDGAKSLSLYSADGKLVAKSISGSIEAPMPGLFVVVTDDVKVKVVIK